MFTLQASSHWPAQIGAGCLHWSTHVKVPPDTDLGEDLIVGPAQSSKVEWASQLQCGGRRLAAVSQV